MKENSFLLRPPKADHRLVGNWKSDAKRTLEEWSWKKNAPAKSRRTLKSLFGKLVVTYTRTKVIWNLRHRNWTTSRHYAVLGSDETSVAIMMSGALRVKNQKDYDRYLMQMVKDLYAKPKIEHIHFAGDHYWISLGRNREFFRRIRKRRS